MNWYYKHIFAQAKGLSAYLESLGITPEIIDYINSLDKETGQFVVNEVRKNPILTIEQIQSIQLPQKNQIDPYLPAEKRLAKNFELEMPEFSKWILVSSRKLRKGVLPSNQEKGTELALGNVRELSRIIGEPAANFYQTFVQHISEIRDWVININPNIASYSPEQALEASDEWHKMMAGQGEGKYYEPIKQELIIYGPKWENPEWEGWTIQKVMSENDLLVEGNRMDHCVGSYCSDVISGNSIIYSLRDPGNNPKVTMETNNANEIEQIQGQSNSEPDNQYKKMIKEWILSKKNPGINSFNEESNLFEEVSTKYGTIDELLEVIDLYKEREYGVVRNSYYSLQDIAELAIEIEGNKRSPSYRGPISEVPDAIFEYAMSQYGENDEVLKEKLNEFEDYAYALEETFWDDAYSHWDTSYFKRPNEEDFETREEFEKAEAKVMEEESDWINEQIRETPTGGFAGAVFEKFNKLREEKKIPEREYKQKVLSSANWYKQAGTTIQFLSYDSFGNFKVLINNKSYTYYDVSPFVANKLKWMIKNVPPGPVIQKLKNFSNPKKHKELNPETYTPKDKQEMLDELYERGILE